MDATIFNGMSGDMAAGVVAGGILGIGTVALIACIWYVLQVIAYQKIFGKFGESGWKSIIPIYNTYTRYKATWNTKMFVVNIVLAALTGLETAGSGTALGPVFMLILDFGSSEYIGNTTV